MTTVPPATAPAALRRRRGFVFVVCLGTLLGVLAGAGDLTVQSILGSIEEGRFYPGTAIISVYIIVLAGTTGLAAGLCGSVVGYLATRPVRRFPAVSSLVLLVVSGLTAEGVAAFINYQLFNWGEGWSEAATWPLVPTAIGAVLLTFVWTVVPRRV